jgi:hypothetical protein
VITRRIDVYAGLSYCRVIGKGNPALTRERQMEKWFEFTAFNSQAHYGFGTEQEASAYQDILNRKREVGQYGYTEITDADALAKLNSGDDTDGFRLDDAIATQKANDEWQASEVSR